MQESENQKTKVSGVSCHQRIHLEVRKWRQRSPGHSMLQLNVCHGTYSLIVT